MNKSICIVQPGRAGDILITLPIAHHYYSKGYDIIWPVAHEYLDIFRNVNFLSHMFVYNIGSINEQGNILRKKSITHINDFYIDLAIGFGNPILDKSWKETELSFDIWKYNFCKLEYQKKYSLPNFINRNLDKEGKLLELKGINYDDNYIVVHENGSRRHFDFINIVEKKFKNYKIIKINKMEGYNIFDWLMVLQNADAIFCVDSCFANLVDQYNIIPTFGRYFHPWKEYYSTLQLKLLTPCIKKDWILV